MSTGDVRGLRPGEGKTTVLTTPIGRMVDYLTVLTFDDSALLIGGGGNQDKVLRWLRKYIFFNDDVRVSDETAETRMFGLSDDTGADLIALLGGDAVAPSLPEHAHRTVALSSGGAEVTLVRAPRALGLSFFVIGRDFDPAAWPGEVVDGQGFEAWRVARGYPLFPNEINEDHIPLEAGLWGAVSFNKGCYTGQEVIARMESRGQIARKLVLLIGDEAELLEIGADLLSEGGEMAGRVTSAARGAALAYVRSAFAQEGALLRSQHGQVARVARIVRI
jgi:aminomethyltransferase